MEASTQVWTGAPPPPPPPRRRRRHLVGRMHERSTVCTVGRGGNHPMSSLSTSRDNFLVRPVLRSPPLFIYSSICVCPPFMIIEASKERSLSPVPIQLSPPLSVKAQENRAYIPSSNKLGGLHRGLQVSIIAWHHTHITAAGGEGNKALVFSGHLWHGQRHIIH